MSAEIELFEVPYRAAANQAPALMTCQSLTLNEERLLWIDGIDFENPVVVPLGGIQARWVGSFTEFMANNKKLAAAVVSESQGRHSPTILVRAILIMKSDPAFTASAALDLSVDQAQMINDDDRRANANLH